jgi:ribosome maturation factor RimP
VGTDPLFLFSVFAFRFLDRPMTHPLVLQILELAVPVAESLGLEVVAAVFHTHQRPPVLRVDVRNRSDDTGLEDCERMSNALEGVLDAADLGLDAYVLEVSSPGVSRTLTTDREFTSFKGFPILVSASEPIGGQQEWTGNLVGRSEAVIQLSQKGRLISVPRAIVTKVQLVEGEGE